MNIIEITHNGIKITEHNGKETNLPGAVLTDLKTVATENNKTATQVSYKLANGTNLTKTVDTIKQ